MEHQISNSTRTSDDELSKDPEKEAKKESKTDPNKNSEEPKIELNKKTEEFSQKKTSLVLIDKQVNRVQIRLHGNDTKIDVPEKMPHKKLSRVWPPASLSQNDQQATSSTTTTTKEDPPKKTSFFHTDKSETHNFKQFSANLTPRASLVSSKNTPKEGIEVLIAHLKQRGLQGLHEEYESLIIQKLHPKCHTIGGRANSTSNEHMSDTFVDVYNHKRVKCRFK